MNANWNDQAALAVDLFAVHLASQGSSGMFTVRDLRIFAEAMGMPKAADNRNWGPVLNQAKRDGVVRKLGLTHTIPLGRAHASIGAVWQFV